MTYIDTSDLRDGALYPYIDVPSSGGGSVSDARLLSMIQAAGLIVDHFCRDTFGSGPGGTSTGGTAASGGTVTLQGDGGAILVLPKRARDVTAVNCLDYAGTSTSFDTAYFRVHSSLRSETGTNEVTDGAGRDYLELVKPLTVGVTGGWPSPPWKIQVVGDFGYSASSIPEVVKWATAQLVNCWTRTDLPPGVDSVDTGGAVLRRSRQNIADTTGLLEVDMALTAAGLRRLQYGYSASGS